ncbi:Hippocampus abundant transcript 1 protein [Nymphon striatum]|nr:Hippocampus abundant transcript 1 protein [Nymphon striatum]
MSAKVSKKVVGMIIRSKKTLINDGLISSGIGEPSVHHALVVIFLEFFAWGLLTTPMITVLNETFPNHTFLMNGLVVGIKGLLSFLSAPLIGALSDMWGRKFLLLITVFFTCVPIPLMKINTWWFFGMISISGVFAVTFSVVFAYVADVTDESDRSAAYGLVSATFAASLVTSPGIGAYLAKSYSDNLVVALASAIAMLDVLFILVAVPESLPEKMRPSSSWGAPITWEQADPFAALRNLSKDYTILLLCVTVFLSYLPEAGQFSCFFVYLKLVMGFSSEEVASFIAVIGVLSVIAQVRVMDRHDNEYRGAPKKGSSGDLSFANLEGVAVEGIILVRYEVGRKDDYMLMVRTGLLTLLMKTVGNKHTIIIALLFEVLQLMWYGFGTRTWMMWAAGFLAAVSSISYPAISSFVSMQASADQQGLVQGMVTGIRGLCNGLGPAVYGVIFYLFNVNLTEPPDFSDPAIAPPTNVTYPRMPSLQLIPGPPVRVWCIISDTCINGSCVSSMNQIVALQHLDFELVTHLLRNRTLIHLTNIITNQRMSA